MFHDNRCSRHKSWGLLILKIFFLGSHWLLSNIRMPGWLILLSNIHITIGPTIRDNIHQDGMAALSTITNSNHNFSQDSNNNKSCQMSCSILILTQAWLLPTISFICVWSVIRAEHSLSAREDTFNYVGLFFQYIIYNTLSSSAISISILGEA